jgi:predicted SnoaL-like aldol condensation-catalyzing enzyme
MKKILFTLALAAGCMCFFVACNNETKEESKTDSKNPKSARVIYDAIESGDVSKVDSFIAADAVHHDPMRGEVVGRDSIKAILADIHNHFKNLKVDVISEVASDDYGFTLHSFKGTTTDNMMMMGVGTNVDMKAVDVVRFKDGKIVEHWEYVDMGDMMKMMNMPKTGADTTKPK